MRRRGERGQTLVESSLVLIVFLSLILGIIDVGQMVFTRQSLADRLRMAARWGSVAGYDEAAIRNMVLYHRPEASTGAGYLGLEARHVQVKLEGTGTAVERVRISIVDFEYPVISPWFGGRLADGSLVESAPLQP